MALAYVLAGVAVALLVAILALLAAIYAEVRRGRRAVEVLAGSGRLLGQRVFYLHDDPSSGRAAGPAPPGSAPAPSSVARGRAAPPGELAPVRAGEVRGPVTSPEAVGTRAGDLSADGAPPSRGPSRVPGPSAAHVGLAPPASAPVLPSGPAIIAAGLGARPKRAREETGEQPFDEDEPTQIRTAVHAHPAPSPWRGAHGRVAERRHASLHASRRAGWSRDTRAARRGRRRGSHDQSRRRWLLAKVVRHPAAARRARGRACSRHALRCAPRSPRCSATVDRGGGVPRPLRPYWPPLEGPQSVGDRFGSRRAEPRETPAHSASSVSINDRRPFRANSANPQPWSAPRWRSRTSRAASARSLRTSRR